MRTSGVNIHISYGQAGNPVCPFYYSVMKHISYTLSLFILFAVALSASARTFKSIRFVDSASKTIWEAELTSHLNINIKTEGGIRNAILTTDLGYNETISGFTDIDIYDKELPDNVVDINIGELFYTTNECADPETIQKYGSYYSQYNPTPNEHQKLPIADTFKKIIEAQHLIKTINTDNCCEIKSTVTGATLILPLSGYIEGGPITERDKIGIYWSSDNASETAGKGLKITKQDNGTPKLEIADDLGREEEYKYSVRFIYK